MLDRLRKPARDRLAGRLRASRLPPWTLPARALPAWARRLRPPRRLLHLAGFVAVVLVGAWLGLAVGGRSSTPIGPVDTHMAAQLSWSGDTVVRVGPLGTLTFDTHDGPIGVTVTVDQLNLADARYIFENPETLDGLEGWVTSDVRGAVTRMVIRSALAAVAGAVILALLVYRRRVRRIALVGAAAAGVVLGTFGTAAATWNPRAVSEPKYTGLLVGAPSVVGNAQDIVSGFSNYSQELAKLVTNVSKLYDVTSTLPAYEPDPSTIRVLHVADIHLNPAAWNVIASISQNYNVQVIVDSGDISDHGSKPERRFVDPISDLGVPYVFVRGNHDSQAIADAVAAEPNAIVLDGGETRQVAGLTFIGDGDPRFTPDRSVEPLSPEGVAEAGRILALAARESFPRPDVAVVHDPVQGEPLDEAVPLILAGHGHNRSTRLLEGGSRLFVQGSTGGAGLRALEGETPTPIQCTLFYFDAETKRLQAWDDFTLGGLGLSSAQVIRTIAPEEKARIAEEQGGSARGGASSDVSDNDSSDADDPAEEDGSAAAAALAGFSRERADR